MKKFLFASAALAVCALFSCKDEKATDTAADPSTRYKEMNAMIYHTIETGDTAGLKNWIAADAIDHNGNADMTDVHGADSIIGMLAQVHNGFQPGMKYSIVAQAVDGDYIFTLAHLTGTTTATPMWGMPANMKMDSQDISLVKIKDGHASEHWEYLGHEDVMNMMKMMGSKDPMGAPPAGSDKMKMDTAKKM